MSALNSYLKELLEEASAQLPMVTQKRMFGADAFFANSAIYGMVWDGRIVLKIKDEAVFKKLRAMEGADVWAPMPSKEAAMKYWVVVSEALHENAEDLVPWVEIAHRLAMSAGELKKKPVKKKPTKKKK